MLQLSYDGDRFMKKLIFSESFALRTTEGDCKFYYIYDSLYIF